MQGLWRVWHAGTVEGVAETGEGVVGTVESVAGLAGVAGTVEGVAGLVGVAGTMEGVAGPAEGVAVACGCGRNCVGCGRNWWVWQRAKSFV